MSPDLQSLNADVLRQMSFSQLKRIAKKNGIKRNLKAEKIIAALTQQNCEDIEKSPIQDIINASRKDKENMFDEGMMTPLETPRRGTFTVATPNQNLDLNAVSFTESPVGENSIKDISNVTVLRGSERKPQPRKVNFASPAKYIGLKDRPKTPSTIKTSVVKQVSFSSPQPKGKRLSEMSYRTTPHPKTKKSASEFDSAKKLNSKNLSARKVKATPNFKKIHERAFEKMESIDDYCRRKTENSNKKLHMAKNQVKKPKSKIPVPFGGIPFIPTATRDNSKKLETSGKTRSSVSINKSQSKAEKRGVLKDTKLKENNSSKGKMKFDLQASLSRKLGYKPYTGPIKPLSASNRQNQPTSCAHMVKSDMMETKRSQRRTVLQGVRMNNRFELQMKNRKLH